MNFSGNNSILTIDVSLQLRKSILYIAIELD